MRVMFVGAKNFSGASADKRTECNHSKRRAVMGHPLAGHKFFTKGSSFDSCGLQAEAGQVPKMPKTGHLAVTGLLWGAATGAAN
jgi:hypothetical protein